MWCYQVEIKLRLQDEEAHAKVAKALEPNFRETHKQENIFYDGSEGELSKKRVIVRTRFYNTDKRCLLTIKVGIGVIQHLPPIPLVFGSSTLSLREAGSDY